MPYVPHTDRDIEEALKVVGAESIEELLSTVPAALRLKKGLDLPRGLSEQGLKKALKAMSSRNSTVEDLSSFLGAGSYNHYIPSTVESVISRSEFYTAYTPYQPEVSQGTLQAIFEYQTLVCQLTGMDVSNASLYDGASAVAEAVLMARRITRRDGVLLSSALHPEYRETVGTYLKGARDSVSEVMYCTEAGVTLPGAVEAACTDDTACLVVQHPNFFGCIEDVEELSGVLKKKGVILIVAVTEPVSLALLNPPGRLGADIVVGENQSFGNPLNLGGPYLGFMATREEYLRQMPGRIVGQTVDREGRRAYCLTFATREQHIRRERATSNICTNQGLCALAAAVHLVSLGLRGIKKLARTNLSRAYYLRKKLLSIEGVAQGFASPVFNEFTIRIDGDPERVLSRLLEKKIIGGLALKRFYPELKNHILVTATEMNLPEDIDRFAAELRETF
ncbi:MAG TPA: aminomethyl-transferring glycine dehydrogenase subunit GcvPA [Thermodesulfobacteriota bacterium]|nr:aminomethyl-transferring glycine dehydrogenase subunit GcvPA [Thermodesulfobacteriota bacterium]